ncbi:MAG: DUF1553 domain-containing protein [Leptolyngbya sp. PLA1]|nr:DUF1553 domain-containing protein [Leptolyngbya sp. PLA1]
MAMLDAHGMLVLGEGDVASALWQTGGRLHPILVHFPIALVALAAGAEVLSAVMGRRGRARGAGMPMLGPSVLARGCLVVGAPAAGITAWSGWLNAAYEHGGGGALEMEGHRWVGIAAGAVALMALVAVLAVSWRATEVGMRVYRALVVLAAMLMGAAGHLGGSMVYGGEYLFSPLRAALGWERAPAARPAGAAAGEDAGPPVDFAAEVWPILEAACIDCHGDVRKRGQLRLDSLAAALKGGKSGPGVVRGDPDASQVIRRVKGLDGKATMPEDADPLAPEQIEVLERWVRQGAVWPETLGATDTGVEERHWAYQPVAGVREGAEGGVIDGMIGARLKAEGMVASGRAEPGVLLRRLSLDLTGLPPTVAELEAFERSPTDEAWSAAVERMVGSAAYAEHWAGWWLDQARYADSRGYEKDQTWSMWPYRDWVIGAFASGMGFDRFTREQLAGDLLAEATQEQVVATGFSRCSMINEEGGVDPEEFRVNTVVDRANTVATVWLGTTLSCAQCHDHKFDPFTQKDYYRFFAYFNGTPVETEDLGSGETRVVSPEVRVAHPMEERWKAEAAAIEEWIAAAGEVSEDHPKRAELRDLKGKLERGVTTQVMREMKTPRITRVLERGSFLSPGEVVTPGTPSVLPSMGEGARPDRLGLAAWLTDARNPLTARVIVNRVWARYFGRGIVETDDDFGTRGTPPTHPEVLDYLAGEFVRSGWDLRHVHRLIVTTEAYRRSSAAGEGARERDPENRLLGRGPRHRLDAEVIRDQALELGGLLSREVGGPSVFPPQPAGVWGHAYSGEQWKESEGSGRYRRGLYTFWKRSTPYPSFVAFDAPSRQVSCTRRPRTNTALQALVTLNDPVYVEAAAGLAGRMEREGGEGAAARAGWAMHACTGRRASGAEVARLVRLYEETLAGYRANTGEAERLLEAARVPEGERTPERAAWTLVANVILNLDEVLTKG